MWDNLWAFLGAAVLLTLAPGPDILFVLTQSLSHGKKTGIVTALGLSTGVLIHTTLLAFGVSILIQESPLAFKLLKIAGAVYLIYLAFQVWKSDSDLELIEENQPAQKLRRFYGKGLVMNLVNPKVIIFFLAFFPGFLWDETHNLVAQFYLLGGIFSLQALIIFSMVSLSAHRLRLKLMGNKNSLVFLKWLQIFVFVGIAIFILL